MQATLPVARFNLSRLAAPVLIIMLLAMMILPLPTLLLDLFFTFNIALSITVLMVAVYTMKPLDFSVFPTLLLLTTLLRLSLNVASSRIVLLEGHQGGDAAGKVIEAFGHFLVGGNYAVGFVVFIILTIINFVVITKGAGRIAEVSARFTLDAMPGKQMAIDADLNAGLIGEEEARRRRLEVSQEADFYGSMDGSSKFVRGDAVAGILIIAINIIGGLFVGMLQHDLDWKTALDHYTLLAVGDGLVAQIPALVISTAAGLIVSRVGTDQDMGQQLQTQLLSKPVVLLIVAVLLGALGLIPGMPHLSFLILSAALGAAWWRLTRAERVTEEPPAGTAVPLPVSPAPVKEVTWDDVAVVDVLCLEVGYRLIPLVDEAQDGELLRRVRGIRKKFAQDTGFLVPPLHIRDNVQHLKMNNYRITLKGVEVGSGEALAGQYLAINPGHVQTPLQGIATQDPAFGLPAVWIDADRREQAQGLGYTVADASTVVATHLTQIIQAHAAELLGREETQQLVDHFAKTAPKMVEDLIPKVLPLSTLQRVLQGLLEEKVSIRDLRSIFEVLHDAATQSTDPASLTAVVRQALGRAITQQIFGGTQELPVIALSPPLESLLMQALGGAGGLEPGLAENLLSQAGLLMERQAMQGQPPVLLVSPALRPLLAKFLRRHYPQLHVLAHTEIPDAKTIKVSALLGETP